MAGCLQQRLSAPSHAPATPSGQLAHHLPRAPVRSSRQASAHLQLSQARHSRCTCAARLDNGSKARQRGPAGLQAASNSLGSIDDADVPVRFDPAATPPAQRSEDSMAELAAFEEATEQSEARVAVVSGLVGAAVAFGVGVWATMGQRKGAEFFAGYLLEQSLSVDNLFVFILVFDYFRTPRRQQDTVLTYGLATAAILRLVMILAGSELIAVFEPVLLGFAAVLLFSAYKIVTRGGGDEDEDLADNAIVKLCRRFIPVSEEYDGNNFFTERDGQRLATPLLLVLAVIELSDVVFAVDSVPAVFGVTRDPFILWTSNMFAIVSLRALYGFVASAMAELRFLEKAVSAVLGWIGGKMIAEFCGASISTEASLGIVAGTLAVGVGASLVFPEAKSKE